MYRSTSLYLYLAMFGHLGRPHPHPHPHRPVANVYLAHMFVGYCCNDMYYSLVEKRPVEMRDKQADIQAFRPVWAPNSSAGGAGANRR